MRFLFAELLSPRARQRVLIVPDAALYIAFRLPRALRSAGWEPIVWTTPGHLLRHSSHLAEYREWPNEAELLAAVAAVLAAPAPDFAAIVFGHEPRLRALWQSLPAAVLARWWAGAESDARRAVASSKEGLRQPLTAGWPVPPTAIVQTAAAAPDAAAALGWPIILKPLAGAGGGGVAVWQHSTEALPPAEYPALAQRFLPGRVGLTEFLCRDGQLVVVLHSYKRRTRGRYGSSIAREYFADPARTALAQQVATTLRWEGFGGFDWVEDAAGRPWLIEFHPRLTSGWRMAAACGIPWSKAWQAWLDPASPALAQPFELAPARPPSRPLIAEYFSPALLAALRQRDWDSLRQWLPGSGAHHDYYLADDLGLFLAWLWRRLRGRPVAA